MLILGLHFGHDASVALIRDGEVIAYLLKERFTRVKHAATLNRELIEKALEYAGVEPGDIDACAVSSTQLIEPVVDDGQYLKLELVPLEGQEFGSRFKASLDGAGIAISQYRTSSLLDIVYGEREGRELQFDAWTGTFPEHREMSRDEQCNYDWFDTYHNVQIWEDGLTLDEISNLTFTGGIVNDSLKDFFHYPATLTLDGASIPACYIHHHFAHAASSYYQSGFDDAAILAHDGFANGRGYHSGMFYFGTGGIIHPIGPHHLALGGLYDFVGMHLGLGSTGPAGKLMGLAAYGRPRFFDSRFVGNEKSYRNQNFSLVPEWIAHCEERAQYLGYDMTHYRNPEYATAPINADIAASTQKVFEQSRLLATTALSRLLQKNNLKTSNLCLSGGTALNCPSNTQIFNESPFSSVFVEPCCDDSGISLGAALALYHSILGNPIVNQGYRGSAYLGINRPAQEIDEFLKATPGIAVQIMEQPGEAAAADLADNKIVGWYQGSSEIGPRALGARSLLCHPGYADNWPRLNALKKRESWRPFAPAVLEEKCADWFFGAPEHSPYMLFNATVKSDRIPAVTHVDNTARIQTVDADNGRFHDLLVAFDELTDIPVVLNTSFNGPGEPIVESPAEALEFLFHTELDVLYLENYRVTRSVS